jgi:hypothetical protein
MTTGKSLPSLNSLIFEICRGPAWKKGSAVVAGILHHTGTIDVIAGLGNDVKCYDTRTSRVKSKLTGQLSAFALPKKPRHAEYFIDNHDAIENVSVVFLLEDVPLPCMSFVPGATIVGEESSLREALKGRKFIPRAYWRDIAAMEIQ